MPDIVKIEKINEVFIKIYSEKSILREISDRFTFKVPDYRFSPQFKSGYWDGTIKLFNLNNRFIYSGLRQEVESFCKSRGYIIEYISKFEKQQYNEHDIKTFIETLNLPKEIIPHDYQFKALLNCINEQKRLTLLPTGAGKSLCIYMISKFYPGKKLIIVNTTGLVTQLRDDFISYNCDPNDIHTIYSGQEKNTDKNIVIGTWQSLVKLPVEWFSQFDVVQGDEAHLFKATSLKNIMEKLLQCKYRFGWSGTLDGAQSNEMTLTGLFGPIHKEITTKELIDRGTLSPIEIKILQLKYSNKECDLVSAAKDYQKELDYIVTNKKRNNFIKNLSLSCSGNTLILFQFVEKHGNELFKLINDAVSDRKVYYIHGGIDGENRNEIRKIIETENDAIIIASRPTFGTGINIKRLHNIIIASPLKAQIGNLQAIGRGLRTAVDKTKLILYDISDDFRYKNRKNITWKHMENRIQIYNREQFNFKIYRIPLNE